MVEPVFARTPIDKGVYESFYLRAVAPEEPVGAWIRYTVHKLPGQAPQGSLWCTVFDAALEAPFMHKYTSPLLSVPAGGWIAIDDSSFGSRRAVGNCGPASWDVRVISAQPELRHLAQSWLYRAPLPRTKLTSPAPAARFDGTIELPHRTLELDGWRGMVGHNWGSEHAERWIWLHGVGFAEDEDAWIDVALGRVLVAGRLTPWLASGAICSNSQRLRLGGIGARGLRVAESPERCSLVVPGPRGLLLEAHVDNPPGTAASWVYADPREPESHGRTSEHDVVNCSIARLSLNLRPRDGAATALHTDHGGAYELGLRPVAAGRSGSR